MHADCTGVMEANPIFAMAEAVGAESGGDTDDQELDMVGVVFHFCLPISHSENFTIFSQFSCISQFSRVLCFEV